MRPRTSRTLTALAAAAALVSTAAPAHADPPDQAVPITPASTTVLVTGNGFGHGHGMSQYGAKGAAALGQTYQQILAYYYPTTALAPAGGKVRVLITADNDNNLKVAPAPGLRVRDLGNGRTYKLRKKARAWRMKTVGAQTRVYYKTGHWHLYRTGGRAALAGSGEFRSSTNQLTLKLPTGSRVYRGKLRFTGSDTVNVVRLDRYVSGVVASEMPSSWPAEALKAQAVAARTYAARERADHAAGYYDLCDTAACQVYGGVVAETAATNAAVAGTAGLALVFGGQYAFAQFSSSNGGYSSAGTQPYLTAHDDAFDRAVSPYLHWKVAIDTAKLQARYPQIGTLTQVQITQREGGRLFDAGGWVEKVHLIGTNGITSTAVDISGDDFRRVYGLRSAYFTFDPVP
jgi:stage II sporulation protein D